MQRRWIYATLVVTTVALLGLARNASGDHGHLFAYGFDANETIEEAGSPAESSSPDWWVNSGGRLLQQGGYGSTMEGDDSTGDRWRNAYASSNPTDTDNGLHPQNLFRLATRQQWKNLRQRLYFNVDRYNLSGSPNRGAPNGVHLFNRYQDEANLYYVGIRVDGTAAIKKKLAGKYTTLGQAPVFSGTYNRDTNPILLPEHQWIGITSLVKTNPDNSVQVTEQIDKGDGKGFVTVLEAVDTGTSSSGPAILNAGNGGVRTDFLDVKFDGYQIEETG